jgi:GAF domain-containing protein
VNVEGTGVRVGRSGAGTERPPALFAGVEPLEVFVELLADIDTDTSSTEFYDRICEAICRLTTMRRAAIFMADAGRRRVRAVGAHGTSFAQLAALRPTLFNTPIAQRALREDQVVVVSERIEEAVPPDYAEVLGITTLVCTPMSAAGRAYGVICADRGGGRFELSDGERHLLWTLGKTAALVATARNATRQQERARRLGERIDLAREIHERVLQRLFGVGLALLRAGDGLDARRRARATARLGRGPRAGRLAGGGFSAARPRAARAVGSGGGIAKHRQARRAVDRRSVAGAGRRHVHARGPQRRRPARRSRRGDGSAAGGIRGAPAGGRRRFRGGWLGPLARSAGRAAASRGGVIGAA